ncbi:hypothetical protein BDAP_001519 [Binucleata daphniae]
MNLKERRLRRENKIKKSREYSTKKELKKIGKEYNVKNENISIEKSKECVEKKVKIRMKPKQNKYKQPLMKNRLSNILEKITKE